MMEENQFEKKRSLDVHSSPAPRTSRRRVPTQTAVHWPPNTVCVTIRQISLYVWSRNLLLWKHNSEKMRKRNILQRKIKQFHMKNLKRSRWPCDLRRSSAASRLLESRVCILLRALILSYLVFDVRCLGGGLCNELVTGSNSNRKCV